MAYRFFRKRPAARIRLGNTFLGKKISARAEGFCVYKEWDAADRRYYYWEEWELRGFNDYDSWIEYDHYTRKVSLYEPLKPLEAIDPQSLKRGDVVQFTPRRTRLPLQAHVTEAGVGTIERLGGKFTYYVFEGDPVAYAECIGPGGTYSIEKYNDKEFDIYKSTELDRQAQKELLGRVVAPSLWGLFRGAPLSTQLTALAVTGIVGWSFLAPLFPRYQTYCTPRSTVQPPSPVAATGTTGPAAGSGSTGVAAPTANPGTVAANGDQVISQDSNQTCYRRTVYGGGGGGVGK